MSLPDVGGGIEATVVKDIKITGYVVSQKTIPRAVMSAVKRILYGITEYIVNNRKHPRCLTSNGWIATCVDAQLLAERELRRICMVNAKEHSWSEITASSGKFWIGNKQFDIFGSKSTYATMIGDGVIALTKRCIAQIVDVHQSACIMSTTIRMYGQEVVDPEVSKHGVLLSTAEDITDEPGNDGSDVDGFVYGEDTSGHGENF